MCVCVYWLGGGFKSLSFSFLRRVARQNGSVCWEKPSNEAVGVGVRGGGWGGMDGSTVRGVYEGGVGF